jgi:hypothetical protein
MNKYIFRVSSYFLIQFAIVYYSVAEPIKLCDAFICFINDDAKSRFEHEENCTFSKCTYSVRGVKDALSKIKKTDPTYGFYRNQACIADKACGNKNTLDNSQWLDKVVYDFITPLVEEKGNWKAVKEKCESSSLPVGKGLFCQQSMAEYHISNDLQISVNKNGCGTEKDWDQIGEWLKECINAGVSEDVMNGLQGVGKAYAKYTVAKERDKVRNACIEDRVNRNLKAEV